LKSKKKYDFSHFPYFLEGHRLQAAKKKKLKALSLQGIQKQCLCSFLHLKFPQETFILHPGGHFWGGYPRVSAVIRTDIRGYLHGYPPGPAGIRQRMRMSDLAEIESGYPDA
jgi:hypothetical protein